MTNKNITIDIPFLLDPVGKDYLWGGNKLKTTFNKNNIKCSPLAETWECSTHPAGLSRIRQGDFAGRTLLSVITEYPEILCNAKKQFPVLLKLIDAKEKLSVQIHPSDEFAQKYERGQQGKTELWYILDARPDSFIYLGFKSSCGADKIRSLIANGRLESVLNKIPVKKGDAFLVRPGTVHAIGGGIVLAEVQQNSDITYRLYDYERRDCYGNLRPLHIEKALSVMNFIPSDQIIRRVKNIKYDLGLRKEYIIQCEYFRVDIWTVAKKCNLPKTILNNVIVLCVEGCGILGLSSEGKVFRIQKGDCFFIPKTEKEYELFGELKIVLVSF